MRKFRRVASAPAILPAPSNRIIADYRQANRYRRRKVIILRFDGGWPAENLLKERVEQSSHAFCNFACGTCRDDRMADRQTDDSVGE